LEGQENDGVEKETRQSTTKTDAMGVGEGGWGSSVAAMVVRGIRTMDKGGGRKATYASSRGG